MGRLSQAARKQALLRLQLRLLDPRRDCGPRRFGQLELYRPLRFSLNDHGPSQDLVSVRDVADAEIDEIATTQLTVDREVEHCQVSNLMGILKLNSDRPDVLRL